MPDIRELAAADDLAAYIKARDEEDGFKRITGSRRRWLRLQGGSRPTSSSDEELPHFTIIF